MSTENPQLISVALADPRLQRLLVVAQDINALLSKMQVAKELLARGGDTEDLEDIRLAREGLHRDLERGVEEAKQLMPAVEELVVKIEGKMRQLEKERKMNLGLAKIEGLGDPSKAKAFSESAAGLRSQITEHEYLIKALDALAADVSFNRMAPVTCPRCTSTKILYRITPSEFGFTLYKCNECGNAWKITGFSLRVG